MTYQSGRRRSLSASSKYRAKPKDRGNHGSSRGKANSSSGTAKGHQGELIAIARYSNRNGVLNRQWSLDTMMPMCPICQKPIVTIPTGSGVPSGFDVHEVFLTRGDVQGCSRQAQLAIQSLINCVAVHTGRCHEDAQHTEEGKIACASLIVGKEGLYAVQRWLEMMKLVTKLVAEHQLAWVNGIFLTQKGEVI